MILLVCLVDPRCHVFVFMIRCSRVYVYVLCCAVLWSLTTCNCPLDVSVVDDIRTGSDLRSILAPSYRDLELLLEHFIQNVSVNWIGVLSTWIYFVDLIILRESCVSGTNKQWMCVHLNLCFDASKSMIYHRILRKVIYQFLFCQCCFPSFTPFS